MTEQRVYWFENSKGEMERVETRDVDIIPDRINEQYRVVGKTKGGHIETSVPECYYNGAKRTKEFWDKTKYYKQTWIQKRIIGEWADDE